MIANVIPRQPEIYEINLNIPYTSTTTDSLVYTLELPYTGYLDLFVRPIYVNANPTSCKVSQANNLNNYNIIAAANNNYTGCPVVNIAGLYVTAGTKLYIYTAHAAANSNRVLIQGVLQRLS